MAEQSSGRVFLVGAGPGDPSLCTVRGVRCLTEADLVLYDALAHPDLLAHAKQASLEFVGKRAGRKSARQEQINQRMKEAANAGQTVVRLKGGDPYLFGRGSEEAEFLAREGIPFEVVPGVPSPIVATAYAGLSLTHRTLASSVAYLTATESPAKDRSSHDWAKLATGPETLVIFMGLRRLRSLMGLLIEHGRSADTPVALVSRASLPSQRTVIGTVATIADQAEEADLPTPALVIVGQVVTLRSSLRWFDRKPLFGQRVLVTRPRAQAASFCERLRDAAAAPVVAPTVRIVPPEDPEPLVRAVKELRRYRWVLFTSKNGVDRFFAEVERQGLDARALGNAQVAAIGPGTARAILRYGVRADLIPDVFRGEALAEAILNAAPDIRTEPVLLPRALEAREILPEMLRARGATIDVVPAYRSLEPTAEARAELRGLVEDRAVDIVTFTASSTVTNLLGVLGDDAASLLSRLTVAAIGPITAATAERAGVRVDVTAEEYTIDGLVAALTTYYQTRAS